MINCENKNIKYNDEELHIKTSYQFKSRTKNFIYFSCYLRNKCKGSAKIDILKKKLIITKECDNNITHENITYEEFKDVMDNKNINSLNFNDKKIQKYYVYYALNEKNDLDNPTLKINFKNLTTVT